MDGEAAADVLDQRPADVVGAIAGALVPDTMRRQRDVVARARQRIDHVGAQHLLFGQRCVSTTGASPVTVIVSSSEPTRRSASTVFAAAAGEKHAITLERVEPGQRERDGVCARTQIDDLIATVAVGDHRPDLLDEHWAGRFDRHAGQHRP